MLSQIFLWLLISMYVHMFTVCILECIWISLNRARLMSFKIIDQLAWWLTNKSVLLRIKSCMKSRIELHWMKLLLIPILLIKKHVECKITAPVRNHLCPKPSRLRTKGDFFFIESVFSRAYSHTYNFVCSLTLKMYCLIRIILYVVLFSDTYASPCRAIWLVRTCAQYFTIHSQPL